jgi:hypothetical protein
VFLSCSVISRAESSEECAQLGRALLSIRPFVDEIVLIHTGYRPPPVPRAVDVFGVFTGCNNKAGHIVDFASARNFAWRLAHGSYITWIDSDDVFAPADSLDHDVLRRQCEPGKLIFYPYAQPDGWQHPLARIAKRNEAVWKWPIHEGLTPLGEWKRVNGPDAVWRHVYEKSHTKDQIERNLRICRHWENHPAWQNDARFNFLLAEAERASGNQESARRRYEKSYFLFPCGNEYRFLIAWEMCGYDSKNEGKWVNALIENKPEWPNGYFAKARYLWNTICDARSGADAAKAQAQKAIDLVKMGLTLPRDPFTIRDYGDKDNFEIYKTLSLAQTFVGDIEGAVQTCQAALALRQDEGFAHNLRIYEQFLAVRPKG